MGQGKQTQCEKCFYKLNKIGVCPKCGWSYERECLGQQELFKKEEEKK